MILIKYCKIKGAEFIPHLDTLNHLNRIIRRTGIEVKYSQGFNPHMLIYMSSPIALGLKSLSEYCLINTDYTNDDFIDKFNACSPLGIKATEIYFSNVKLNVASDITSATYIISGLNKFDVNEVLNASTFTVPDKHSVEKEVKDRIISLYFDGDDLIATLKFGNVTLRPDALAKKLKTLYGGEKINIIKQDVKFLNDLTCDEYVKGKNNV